MFGWFLIALLPFAAIIVLQEAFDIYISPAVFDCLSNADWRQYSLSVLHLFEALMMVGASVLLRNVWEEFDIRKEVKIILVVDILMGLVQLFTVLLVDSDMPPEVAYRFLINFRCAIFFFVSMYLPLVKSTRGPVADIHIDRAGEMTLSDTLVEIDAYDQFSRFMFVEGGSKLLQFYVEIEFFRDISNDEQRFQEAVRIYSTYLLTDEDREYMEEGRTTRDEPSHANRRKSSAAEASHPEIILSFVASCLPFDLIEDIHDMLRVSAEQGVPVDSRIYDEAQTIIFGVMNEEYYPSFLNSNFYTRLTRLAKEQAKIKASLRSSSMI